MLDGKFLKLPKQICGCDEKIIDWMDNDKKYIQEAIMTYVGNKLNLVEIHDAYKNAFMK